MIFKMHYTGWAKSSYKKFTFYSYKNFFMDAVNAENYLEMLHEVVVRQLQTKPNFDELFFQQDEASPHYVLRVRDYFKSLSTALVLKKR